MKSGPGSRIRWPDLWSVLMALVFFGAGLAFVGTVVLAILGFPMILIAVELLTPKLD